MSVVNYKWPGAIQPRGKWPGAIQPRDGSWTTYKELRYASDGIPGSDLEDFPKRFKITGDSDIAAALSSGGGIRITTPDGLTELPIGIYPDTDLSSGDIHIRTRLDLSASASVGDPMCRLYYSATETTVEDRARVTEGDYALFMPMEESPGDSAPQLADWVTKAKLGTANGGMGSGDSVSAQVGKGVEVDGADDYISVPDSARLDMTGPTTIEVICQRSAASGDSVETLLKKESNYILRLSSTGALQGFFWDGDSRHDYSSTVQVTDSGFHHLALVIPSDVADGQFYLDGEPVNTSLSSNAGGGLGLNNPITIGGIEAGNEQFAGVLDETRVSSVDRSADWIAYAYEDDFDNANTFSVGPEEGGEEPELTVQFLLFNPMMM